MNNSSKHIREISLRAFTLVEILVSIAVIALLISLIIPAVGAANNAANLAVDLANNRQLNQVMTTLALDNQGRYISTAPSWGDPGWVYPGVYNKLTKEYGLDKSVMSCNAYRKIPRYWDAIGEEDPRNGMMFMGWNYMVGDVRRFSGHNAVLPKTVPQNVYMEGKDYYFPQTVEGEATSETLITCYGFTTDRSWKGILPHVEGEPWEQIESGHGPYQSSLSRKIDGMNMSYRDGSGRWVDFKQMGAMEIEGGGGWFYYDLENSKY